MQHRRLTSFLIALAATSISSSPALGISIGPWKLRPSAVHIVAPIRSTSEHLEAVLRLAPQTSLADLAAHSQVALGAMTDIPENNQFRVKPDMPTVDAEALKSATLQRVAFEPLCRNAVMFRRMGDRRLYYVPPCAVGRPSTAGVLEPPQVETK